MIPINQIIKLYVYDKISFTEQAWMNSKYDIDNSEIEKMVKRWERCQAGSGA